MTRIAALLVTLAMLGGAIWLTQPDAVAHQTGAHYDASGNQWGGASSGATSLGGNLDLLGNNITDSTQPIEFGSNCSTTHGNGANDVLFCGDAEFDGVSRFDGNAHHFTDNANLNIGISPGTFTLKYDTGDTNEHLKLYVQQANVLAIVNRDHIDSGDTYAPANRTDPTVSVYSNTASGTATDQHMDVSHNATDGLLQPGVGGVDFGTADYLQVDSYLCAGVPSAAVANRMVVITDATVGNNIAWCISDGANWKLPDGSGTNCC